MIWMDVLKNPGRNSSRLGPFLIDFGGDDLILSEKAGDTRQRVSIVSS